jgi:hypothetical protein
MSNEGRKFVINRRVLAGLCVANLFGIFAAGLWPFNPHFQNEVNWLTEEDGLRFGDYGTVLSSGEFRAEGPREAGPCSLEIFLRPGATYDSNAILAFSTQENPLQFRIRQDADMMTVSQDVVGTNNRITTAAIRAEHAFQQGKDLVITVTSAGQAASAYLNGRFVGSSSSFALKSRDFTGQLILGNSPVHYGTWAGVLKGVAIFSRKLGSDEIATDYRDWIRYGHVEVDSRSDVIALYLFNERRGRIVHNRAGLSPDLFIPDYFVTVHQGFLVPPWQEYSPGWGYWKGVLINVAGFIPLGFFLCAYFSLTSVRHRAVLATIITGGFVSLTIEILQAYLPVRDSGMTDIITNTLGTAVGAALYRCVKVLCAKVGIIVS